MKVEDHAFVSIDYKLSLDSGEEIDQSDPEKPLGFIFGVGQIIAGLEKVLRGMEAGQSAHAVVEATEGYGEARAELCRDIPRSDFPPNTEVQPGMVFQASGPHGLVSFRVKDVSDGTVKADFNHPLAGERLHFDVKVTEVRSATDEERAALTSGGCHTEGCSTCGDSCGE